MISYIGYFRNLPPQNAYFGGANTPEGFVSDYGELFDEETFTKVYVVKGGSGTGKSTLIRRCAEAAERCGAQAVYILCGSDPDSLDGVLLTRDGIRIAIVDGTAPHTLDPMYAGACGEIVNCGNHWNAPALEAAKGEIIDIVKQKQACYAGAYRYLAGACAVRGAGQRNLGRVLLREKMEKCIARTVASLGSSHGNGTLLNRRTLALSMKGACRVPVFSQAEHVIAVKDCADTAPAFFEQLTEALHSEGHSVVRSRAPLGDTAELYLPKLDTAFVSYTEEDRDTYEKIINMQRFADKEVLAAHRQKRRFGEKCFDALLHGALDSLSEAKRLHFHLEEIYKAKMDFDGLDQLAQSLTNTIVKRFE